MPPTLRVLEPSYLAELLENERQLIGGDARARVLDSRHERVAVTLRLHHDLAGVREFCRVREQVEQDLADLERVGLDREHVERQVRVHLHLLALEGLANGRDALVDDRAKLRGLADDVDVAGFDLRQIEDVVDEREQGLGVGLDHAEVAPAVRSEP